MTTKLSRPALLAAGAAAALAIAYCGGVKSGRDDAAHSALTARLQTNAHQVAAAKAHQDTAHHAAVAATAAAATHREATRAVQQRVTIIDSSTVRLRLVDSLATVALPPLVVTELHDDRDQIDEDANTIALWIANDSAHLEIERRLDERTQVLEGAVKTESHAALRRGEKIGAVVATVVLVVVHFVLR